VVKQGNDDKVFELFHQIQAETAARQHFIPPNLKDLLAYKRAFGDDISIYYVVHCDGDSPSPEADLVSSEAIIAMGIIIKNGDEADYFEAASTDLNRKLPGAYALQWQVIQDLKKQGIKRYNLWGIAPPGQPHHRYAGVTTFKTGFGGEVTEYIPAQDIIVNPLKYSLTYLIETIRKKRRHLS
jgi:hypothetical protein